MSRCLYLMTYATEKYFHLQDAMDIDARCSWQFDGHFKFRFNDINPDFFETYREILIQPRGAGYWLWKPHLIATAFSRVEYGDVLLYMDCGDGFENGRIADLRKELLLRTDGNDILLTVGGPKSSIYTKRDCFVYMDADTDEYHNLPQLEAGVIVLKKTQRAMDFVNEWTAYCTNPNILTDLPNKCGLRNLADFQDHRHDQSVMTILAHKFGIRATDYIRDYVLCNIKTP